MRGAFVGAAVLAGLAVLAGPTTAANPNDTTPPQMGPIHADFVQAERATYYSVSATDADGDALDVAFKLDARQIDPEPAGLDPDCDRTARGVGESAPGKIHAVLIFHHADSDGCDHNLMGAHGHQVRITAVLTDGTWTCEAIFDGSETDTGPAPEACTSSISDPCAALRWRVAETRERIAVLQAEERQLKADMMAAEAAVGVAVDAVEALKKQVGFDAAAAVSEAGLNEANTAYKKAHRAWELQDEFIDNALRDLEAYEKQLAKCQSKYRAPAAARPGASCSVQRLAVARTAGRASAYAQLLRRYRPLPLAKARTNLAKARIGFRHVARAGRVLTLLARAERSARKPVADLAALKSKGAAARLAATKAKAAFAKCQAGG